MITPPRRGRSAVAIFLMLALTGCGGGRASSGGALPVTAQRPVGSTGTTGFAYAADFVQSSTLVAPASFGRMAVDAVLKMQNPDGLRAYAKAVADPQSPSYRRFLTPQQIADLYGATQANQNAAIAYFASQGLNVTTWSTRMMLRVEGTQAQLEAAFHTKFGAYVNDGETVIAPMTPPSLPAGVPVVGSANIVHRTKRFAPTIVKTQQASNGNQSGYSPQQIAAAFDFDGAYNAGYTGTGITIGIIGTGGISVEGPGHEGDVDAFKKLYGVGGSGTVTIISADPGSSPPPNAASGFTTPLPVTDESTNCTDGPPEEGGVAPGIPPSESPSVSCNPEDIEAQLDTEQAASLAPNANIEFYLSYNPNDGCVASNGSPVIGSPCPTSTSQPAGQPGGPGWPFQGLAEVDEELQTAIDRHTADVISLSFGGAEYGEVAQPGQSSPPAEFDSSGNGLEPMEFAALASEGIAVFASSGDSGAEACQASDISGHLDQLCVNYPATDPNVVAVGGVTTPLDSAGQFIGPIAGWGVQTTGGDGATGGGISLYFLQSQEPDEFQAGAPGITGSYRNIPDLALEADVSTGVPVLLYADSSYSGSALYDSLFDVGGTSVAAPEMAAMWALVLQACKATPSCQNGGSYRLGDPNPLFYKIYESATEYPDTFYDVTYGNNSQLPYCQINSCAGATPEPQTGPLDPGYNAGTGYDLLTGIGVPFARALIRAIVKV
ncbi:MAG TPA: protease pro-enzyme activation domain-containing protein [Candidatus Acidoferrales bacterium]|nr:protease pro-enzyme activation domain-containing protein [Candidatus Acidoferrales bacterium]